MMFTPLLEYPAVLPRGRHSNHPYLPQGIMPYGQVTGFTVVYHPLVVSDDIPKLSKEWKEKVRRAIEERLVTHPDLYGKPLRRSLKGYRKLRVGDYRIIFKIEKNTIRILVIQHRSVVYGEASKRT